MQADTHRPPERRIKRLFWFVLIYLVSLAAFAALVYGLRFIIPH
ncbi:hypothetical protein [Microvirga sp. KLBC 81]|nr:hypothetical protein [Microvirga sp. KLBC 81]